MEILRLVHEKVKVLFPTTNTYRSKNRIDTWIVAHPSCSFAGFCERLNKFEFSQGVLSIPTYLF